MLSPLLTTAFWCVLILYILVSGQNIAMWRVTCRVILRVPSWQKEQQKSIWQHNDSALHEQILLYVSFQNS